MTRSPARSKLLPVDDEWITVSDAPVAHSSAPAGATAVLPVVVYIHGAGWVFGNAHTHDRLVRELAVGTGAAVVFPNYSLSPEAKYPAAIEQSYATVTWIAEHGASTGSIPSPARRGRRQRRRQHGRGVTILGKERGEAHYPGPGALLPGDGRELRQRVATTDSRRGIG